MSKPFIWGLGESIKEKKAHLKIRNTKKFTKHWVALVSELLEELKNMLRESSRDISAFFNIENFVYKLQLLFPLLLFLVRIFFYFNNINNYFFNVCAMYIHTYVWTLFFTFLSLFAMKPPTWKYQLYFIYEKLKCV